MKQQTSWTKIAILPTLLMILSISLVTALTVSAQKLGRDVESPNANNVESGYTSILIGLLRGQYVKVSAVNQDNKDIAARFVMVDDKGKVLMVSNGIVQPGKAVSQTFQHPGGANRIEFYAQIRTASDRDLKLLIPSIQIIDSETDRTEHIIGGDDFFAFRPIFNPPLIELPGLQ